MKFNVLTNFENMVEERHDTEGVVGQMIEIDIPSKYIEDYRNNKVCIQCGYDMYWSKEMYAGVDIKDGLCAYCREGIEKLKECKFVCDCCNKEYYGYPVYGGKEIAPSWSAWSGGDPGGFEEDGKLFCSEKCSVSYYSDTTDYVEYDDVDFEDEECELSYDSINSFYYFMR